MNINRTIIITAALAPLARSLAAGLSFGGVGMFETPLPPQNPLSQTNPNITHYVSSGLIDARFDSVLAMEGASQATKDAAANALYAACQEATPPANVTLAQCQDLVANSIVVDCDVESAQETFKRLGISL